MATNSRTPDDTLTMADSVPETTEDGILGGRVLLRQPRKGHRIGTDAVLLAMMAVSNGHVVDLGCGVGGAGLAFAACNPDARVTLVDNDPAVLGLAADNIGLNRLEHRVCAVDVDVFAPETQRISGGLAREACTLVLTNPPFLELNAGRASPDLARRRAHVLAGGTLIDWTRTAVSCLQPGGTLAMIHRADHIGGILAALEGRTGGVRLRFVHSRPEQPAARVLVLATKGSRAGLVVVSPLVLHEKDGGFTPEAAAIHAGDMASFPKE